MSVASNARGVHVSSPCCCVVTALMNHGIGTESIGRTRRTVSEYAHADM